MKIGFALIVGSPLFENIVKIENQFHDCAQFADRMGIEQNIPHITLFQGNMDERLDYRFVADKLYEKLLAVNPTKSISFSDVVYIPDGWYFYKCIKTESLDFLHHYALRQVETHIILDPSRLNRNLNVLPENQVNAIQNYGYRYSADAFFPHITIGRTHRKDLNLLLELNNSFSQISKDSYIDRITVYDMGNNGTHARTIYEKRIME